MRIIFNLLLIQTILSFSLQAQTITGNVKSNKGIAIAGATVSLLKAADSSIVKLQVSKEDGAFTFAIPDSVHYLITASSVGYSTAYFKLSQSGFPVVLLLQEAPAQMASVVVTAKKPLVQVKGDRTILNVEGTINATGNNVLELLRKSPSVTVNSEDRIGMNGKNSVQIFIDGKPTPLAGADLAAYLKSIQSSEVEAIELVTHPSAKYEAAGNAGIINIRLKKNKSLGTNGSLAAGYNQGVYGKYNSGLSFNHLTAKVNLFGGVTYNDATTQKKINMHRQQTDSAFYQTGTMKEASKTFNFKAGTDYFINTQNTVGLLVNGNFGNSVLANNSFTSISAVHANPSRLLKADNRFRSDRDHLDLNLNYLYAGKEGRTFSFNADYGYYNMTGVQFQPNAYYNGTGQTLLNTITYEMVTPTTIDIYSAKADYEQGFAKGKLGVGVKSSFVATDNDFQHYTFGQSGKS
ncbi:MAG TPA: carboxypeptidase regulatory-like domain-containing protein, partial [Flavisolibacter sp.]